jgi:uncharacterized protein (DUF934 family)
MVVLVGKAGFSPEDFDGIMTGLDELPAAASAGQKIGLTLDNTASPDVVKPWFDRLALIRIAFPAMGDGRGFSLAARLRALGYRGRLRAAGPVIPDQFRAALRSGFDEAEISEDQARRQPESQWLAVRQTSSYQARVRS